MSFSPRGGHGGKGKGKGGGKGKGKGGGKGFEEGPPAKVDVVGSFMHECEGEMVCKLEHDVRMLNLQCRNQFNFTHLVLQMVPYFNAPIYLDKNSKIGKVDEV